MPSPRISVLMACYNAEQYIGAAIESVLNQTFRDFELIVVDDGSTDRSSAVVQNVQSSKIKLFRQQRGGAARARNEAYRNSAGEFIIFLDADDLVVPAHLEALLDRATRNAGCIALSRWDRFYSSPAEAKFPQRATEGDFTGADWLELDWINAQPMTQSGMLLLPRTLLDRHGLWNEKLSLDDDFEFFARLISRSDGIRFAPDAALYYRSAIKGSLSRQTSAAAAQSAFLSLDLGTKHLLSVKDTAKIRRICANLFQAFDYRYFPKHTALRAEAKNRVVELGGSDILPDGPPGFQKLRPWVGWRAARLAQAIAQGAGLNRASRQKRKQRDTSEPG